MSGPERLLALVGFCALAVGCGPAPTPVAAPKRTPPVPLGPLSEPGAGKAAFNEAKATETLYRAGYRAITGLRRGADGAWRGAATRAGRDVEVAVTAEGLVTTTAPPHSSR
ncbi:MAG: hypothetical protein ABI056_07680 [Caulobacteraceae bacterium]